MQNEKTDRLHLDFLDGLRALAALFVILHHSWLQIYPIYMGKTPSPLVTNLTFPLMYGHYAVALFIVISGFCLMLPVIRNQNQIKGGVKTFFLKRAKRILPPYYLAMALSALLIVLFIGKKTNTHWDASLPITKEGVLAHIFLYQNWGSFEIAAQINHAFWSIAVECQIYLFFPLLVLLWQKIGAIKTTVLSIFVGFALEMIFPEERYYLAAPYFLTLFVYGMLACAIAFGKEAEFEKMREKRQWLWLGLANLVLIVILKRKTSFEFFHLSCTSDLLVAGPLFMLLLISASQASKKHILNLLSWKPLVWIGTFSYSIYLMHAPMIQIIWQYLLLPFKSNDGLTFFLLAIPGTLLIVVMCYPFHLICERPFMNTKRSKS